MADHSNPTLIEDGNTITNIMIEGGYKWAAVEVKMNVGSTDEIIALRSLIVRAVNSHDALVKALEECLPFIDPFSPVTEGCVARAASALAKAKGAP